MPRALAAPRSSLSRPLCATSKAMARGGGALTRTPGCSPALPNRPAFARPFQGDRCSSTISTTQPHSFGIVENRRAYLDQRVAAPDGIIGAHLFAEALRT